MEKEKVSSGNIIDFKVLGRLMTFVRPYRFHFIIVIILTVVIGFLAPVKVWLIQYTLDNQVAKGDYQGMLRMIMFMFASIIAHGIFQYVHTYLSGRIGQYVIRDIRIRLYEHLIGLRLKFFDKTPIGRLVTRTVSD